MFFKIRCFFCLMTMALVAGGPAGADMSPFWEDLRQETIAVSARACGGDKEAYRALRDLARDDQNPTAQVSMAWLTTNSSCGMFYNGDEEEATELYAKAAEGGYPLAMGMLGLRLIIGRGTYADRDEGGHCQRKPG